MATQLEAAPLQTAAGITSTFDAATPDTLDTFNTAPAPSAECHLLTLCGSRRWAATLCHKRPFESPSHLHHDAANLWFLLDERDWLEAFACHPRIGRLAPEPATTASAAGFEGHARAEQHAAQQTLSVPVAEALDQANHLYEQRFGFLYIVFASGRTAPELLALLERRLRNDRITELHEAARQQHAITTLRIQKWLQA